MAWLSRCSTGNLARCPSGPGTSSSRSWRRDGRPSARLPGAAAPSRSHSAPAALAVILIVVAGVVLWRGRPRGEPVGERHTQRRRLRRPGDLLDRGAARGRSTRSRPSTRRRVRRSTRTPPTRPPIDTSCGTIRIDLLAETATESVNSFVFLAEEGLLRRPHLAPAGEGFRDPGRRSPGRRHRRAWIRDPGDRHRRLDLRRQGCGGVRPRGGRWQRQPVLHHARAPTQPEPVPQGEYTIFGNVSKGMDVVETIGSFPTVVGPNCPPREPCSPTQPVYINSVTIEES